MITALLTGATGFLGSYLAEVLAEAGVALRAYVRPESDARRLRALNAELVIGDAADEAAMLRAVQGADLLFHVAGYVTAASPFSNNGHAGAEEWPRYQALNVDFTAALLRAARVAGLQRFIYVSSGSVYALGAPVPTPEEGPLGPASLYGRSKLLAEEHVRAAGAQSLPVTIVRPALSYGSGDRAFTPLALQLARLPLLPLIHGGRPLLDLVYARDVAELLWRAASHPAAVGRTYNAGPGQPTSLRDLITAYSRLVGRAPRILDLSPQAAGRMAWLSRPLLRPFLPAAAQALTPQGLAIMSSDIHLDMRRAEVELGFQPRFDLDLGLQHTLAMRRRSL